MTPLLDSGLTSTTVEAKASAMKSQRAEFPGGEHGCGQRQRDAQGADRGPDRGDDRGGVQQDQRGGERGAEVGGGVAEEVEGAVLFEHRSCR